MRADIHDGPEQMLQSKAGYIDARPLTASSAKPLATHGRTIHWVILRLGRCSERCPLAPPTADIRRGERHVRFAVGGARNHHGTGVTRRGLLACWDPRP